MSLRGVVLTLALPLLFVSACGEDTGNDDATGVGESTSPSQSAPSESAPSQSAPSESAPPSPSPGPPPAEARKCAKTWRDEATLPKPYVGCWAGKEFVAPDSQMCGFVKPLITYDDAYWAVPGGTIHKAAKGLDADPAFTADLKGCRA
ncbi:MAG: hypothetical protein L0H93_13215 [Nocardioides sp.]|nr:hypothetical protein [Nocardioides sp.]